MSIQVDHDAFRTGVADIGDAGELLRRARDDIDRDVDQLLREGWSGVAARSFADGWTDWQAAADDVLEGLLAMGGLLTAVHADLTERDLDSSSSLDQTARRITDRLGA